MTVASVLADLVAQAREQTARRRAQLPELELQAMAARQSPPRDLGAALRIPGRLALIAETKQRTPSMGVLVDDYRPADIAAAYAAAGADAISVLTHEAGFGGAPAHVQDVRAEAGVPVLRKDFIVEEDQVLETRAVGADAVLLIAAALTRPELETLIAAVRSLGMAELVEVHDEPQVAAALEAGARIVGVNHRDLRTFEVDLRLTERLRPLVPSECIFVAESGIKDGESARRVRDAGADAVLVGEALMRSKDVASKIGELQVRDR